MAEDLLRTLDLISTYTTDPLSTGTYGELQTSNLPEDTQSLYDISEQFPTQDEIDRNERISSFFFGEEGVDAGMAPDIALSPLLSLKSLIKPLMKNKAFANKALSGLAKLEKRLGPSLAEKSSTLSGYLKPTKVAKFLEKRVRTDLAKDLLTKKAYKRFQHTYPDAGKIFKYDEYKTLVEGALTPRNWDGTIGSWADDMGYAMPVKFKRPNLKGEYSRDEDLGMSWISMRPDIGVTNWMSTLRHELSHKLDDVVTGFATPDYKRLEKVFKKGMIPEVADELDNWNLMRALQGDRFKLTKRVKDIKYLTEPTETLARIKQIRRPYLGQKVIEKFGQDTMAMKQLKSVYTDDFIKELLKDYWAVAPIGIGMEAIDEEMYKDLK